MKNILLTFICISFIFAVTTKISSKRKILDQFKNSSNKNLFKVFHWVYNKNYELNSDEGRKRFKIFKNNLKFYSEYNSKEGEKNKLGVGPFADMTDEEFRDKYLMKPEYMMSMNKEINSNFLVEADDLYPRNLQTNVTTVDFRYRFGDIKNQGQCGDCWAFSSIAAVENNYYECENKVGNFSEQFLLCSGQVGTCDGGYQTLSIQYIQSTSGVPTEEELPYTGVLTSCPKVDNFATVYQIKGTLGVCGTPYIYPPTTVCTANQLQILSQTRPTMVNVCAAVWSAYTADVQVGSIYWTDNMYGAIPDHTVIIVGVGYDSTESIYYYIMRNSWGPDWGDNGYMYYIFVPGTATPITSAMYIIGSC